VADDGVLELGDHTLPSPLSWAVLDDEVRQLTEYGHVPPGLPSVPEPLGNGDPVTVLPDVIALWQGEVLRRRSGTSGDSGSTVRQ
jgi:hypothetical protein